MIFFDFHTILQTVIERGPAKTSREPHIPLQYGLYPKTYKTISGSV